MNQFGSVWVFNNTNPDSKWTKMSLALNYDKTNNFNNSNAELHYKLGTCYFSLRKKQQAFEFLTKAIELNPELNPDAYYYLGLTLQQMLRFDEAINAYMLYGDHLGKTEPLDDISRKIEECNNGKVLVAQPISVTIENLGLAINTKNPEYNPLITADEADLFFTSRRPGSIGGETDPEDLEYY